MTLDKISGNSRDISKCESQVSDGRIPRSGRVVRKMWRNIVEYPRERWGSATPRSKNVHMKRRYWISQVTRVILARANLRLLSVEAMRSGCSEVV
ncbi:hypothetical protein E5676_scaffold3445G00050 [Cucumis melo var. makuwa]|uniref:Uncharacterized protein n=1 Tax=Cucumis melo var. makuwa TaxID=1194695 RepID=A0A5D3DVU3_CUCMM|nr:hypothetical protein E5676_scaffold3445G00050 [Cucumis melo var. makuwa]